MAEFRRQLPLSHPASRVFDWHARPGAFSRLSPPWQDLELVREAEGLADGSRAEFVLHQGPVGIRWVAEHRDLEPGRRFTDVQVRGPFARWVHVHEVRPEGPDASVLEDRVDYALPGGGLGRLLGGRLAERTLDRLFRYRHHRTRVDLDRHGRYADRPRRHVAVTGSSGLLGSALVHFLTTGGHRVTRVVRREAGPGEVRWDPRGGVLDPADLEGVDAVVHLAGESIDQRWTEARKDAILRSRTEGTALLARTLAAMDAPPEVLVSSSATGFYGDRGDAPLDEEASPGEGFLAGVVRAWEAAAEPARAAGIRVVHPRTGMVITAAGGALARLLLPYRLGLGGPVGSGDQVVSWITRDDWVGAIHHLLQESSLHGPVNLTSPESVTNAELASTLGRVLRRPAVLPLPGPAVSLVFGQMGRELLLQGARVVPARLLDSGFAFQEPGLEDALRVELGRMVTGRAG